MCVTLEDSGVASGSTIELTFRGRGGGLEPLASSSVEVEIEPQPARQGRQTSGSVATERMRASALLDSDSTKGLRYDRGGDGKLVRDEVRTMAADFIKEKKTRRLATKAAVAMGVLLLLVLAMNAGLTAAIVFLSMDMKVADGFLFLGALLIRAATRQRTRPRTPHRLRGCDTSSNRSPCRVSQTGIGLRRWLPLGWLALASGFRLPEESGAGARIDGAVELPHGSPLLSPVPTGTGGEVDGARDRRRLVSGSGCTWDCHGSCDKSCAFFGGSCDSDCNSDCDHGCGECGTCSEIFGSSYVGSVSWCHSTGYPSDHNCHLHCNGGKYRVGGGCNTQGCDGYPDNDHNSGTCSTCGSDTGVWKRENGGACHDCAHRAPIELQAQGAWR